MTIRNWVYPAVIMTAGLALAGCGAKQKPETQIDKHPWEVRVESPLDTIQVTPGTQTTTNTTAQSVPSETQSGPVMDTPVVTETAAAMPPSGNTVQPAVQTPAIQTSTPDSKSFIPGWRIQLGAFDTIQKAEAAASKARQHFTEPVYVEYQAPMYKVRLGDFLTKDDAHSMQVRAKAQNYKDAWPVEALVVRPGN